MKPARAPRMSVEDRQAAILDAVIPLLAVHGKDLTSRQIAEAAGIAEGTVFRAFGDKDTLINAAVDRFLDPVRMQAEMRGEITSDDLETAVLEIVRIARKRFADIFKLMALLGHNHRPNKKPQDRIGQVVSEVLSPFLEELNMPPAQVAQVIRLFIFASTVPHLNPDHKLTDREITSIILYGVAGTPKPRKNRN
ncbi:MAG: TetR/AcrR family transcriptional regulator [Cryobacterium sp.]|nr:TetR/AcrR family transcriptional regulator [Cryobacterium sp.]